MSDAERERLLANRPYASLADLRRRGGISRPTAEHLVKAGALDAISDQPHRRATLLAVEELWGGRRRAPDGPQQTALALHADHRPALPALTDAELVRDELEVLSLDVTRHVVAFYEPLFPVLGITRAADIDRLPSGTDVRVAGVRVALQSPPVRSGQQVLFLSLDDRTGTTQCNFFESVLRGPTGVAPGRGGDTSWTVLNAWLVVVEGRLDRRGRRGATVVARRAWDLTRLWRAWGEGRLDDALRRTPSAHERNATRPAGLSASMFASGSR